jgi:hypothetical protein
MATAPKLGIDVGVHDVPIHSRTEAPATLASKGLTLPELSFPRFADLFRDAGPEVPPEGRRWRHGTVCRTMRGWLFPYDPSRILPVESHPITACE